MKWRSTQSNQVRASLHSGGLALKAFLGVEEKERFPNGVKKMNAEPKRKREPAATDNGVKAKAPQKRRLNQSAAKTAKQQRGSADRGTAKPPEGAHQYRQR